MRKLKTAYPFPAVLLAATLVSCSMDWGARTSRPMLPDVPDQAGLPGTLPSSMVLEYYVAGVEYPPGYDWVRDPQYGTVDCTMFLMKDGERILEFGVGYGYGVSPDADMSRCIGDHIYTDYSTSGETVIRKDGEELFRYSGREMIAGFLPDGESVLTLGIPRKGSGWTYRRDGAVLADSQAGIPVSGLYSDEGVTVFEYKETVEEDYERVTKYYIVMDGVRYDVPDTNPKEEIMDFMMWNGTLYMLSVRKDGKEAYFGINYQNYIMDMSTALSCEMECLLADSTAVYALGKLNFGGGDVRSAIWKDTSLLEIFDRSFNIVACYPDGANLGVVGYFGDAGQTQTLYLNGKYTPLPAGYILPMASSGCFVEGHYCLCLLPSESSMPPMCIIDGKEHVMDANGCFVGLGHTVTVSQSM